MREDGLVAVVKRDCPTCAPFRIDGGFEIYPRHRTLPKFFGWRKQPGNRLRVRFGSPIEPPDHDAERTWEQARSLVASLRHAVTKL